MLYSSKQQTQTTTKLSVQSSFLAIALTDVS